jgi:hypothetical protein
VNASAIAHRYLPKPCESGMLRDVIAATLRLQDVLASDGLRRLVGRLGTLPAAPRVYQELSTAPGDPEVDLDVIAAILERDVALATRAQASWRGSSGTPSSPPASRALSPRAGSQAEVAFAAGLMHEFGKLVLACRAPAAYAAAVESRRGRSVATVALARKLAGILFAMMRDGTKFEPGWTSRQPASQAA